MTPNPLPLPPVYRLSELEGTLVRITKRAKDGTVKQYAPVKDLRKAHGVTYLCPVCFHRNGGPVGTEHVLHWFTQAKLPAHATPGPGRWNTAGTKLDDLTFVAPGSFSVNMIGHWHGWIENGTVKVDSVQSVNKRISQASGRKGRKKTVKKPSKSKRR